MSWERFHKPAKRPPPPHGIKVTKLGATWWGQRWIQALEHFSRDYLNRLGRGRSYARAGRVHDLKIAAGGVTAQVTGSRTTPYKVSLGMDAFTSDEWNKIIRVMAQEARFAAELLAGQMPQDIDAAFRQCKRSLFPRKSHDLQTDCSCPDWANPCKHVAAMHYVLGEAFDRDPFLLFELRGRTREQVLEALSQFRSGESVAGDKHDNAADAPIADVAITHEAAAGYEQPPNPLPAMQFNFHPPQSPAAILRSIAPPRTWSLDQAPAEMFGEIYERAGNLARRMALSPEEAGDQVAEATSARRRTKTPPRRKS